MVDYSRALELLREPHQRIYEALYKAAYLGAPCPSNKELAAVSGYPNATPRYASEAVAVIAASGLIEVHRGYKARIVIMPLGQSTKGVPADLAPMRRADCGPPIPAQGMARQTCTYCGVRSDIGCVHTGGHLHS